ncbi:MAG: S9 family peptidase, partial [Candidatus Eremiobacteraeota bacterium]|nr:S9 family peptidase [Candidatus Eremiobacteraeota bacterium]
MTFLLAAAFTLAQVMSAPYVSNLTASPDGTVLVWKMYERGEVNLYTNAGGNVHRVTPYTSDDGLDIDNVHVFASDDAVVYARGGISDNGQGDNINPRSIIPPPVRTVYVATLTGGTPVAVGEGLDGAVSPKSDRVAWIYNGNLMTATLQRSGTTFTAGKPVQLPIRGQVAEFAWSPDGSRIALTNARTDHSYIAIYDLAQNSYVYATPDFSADQSPVWSPDGKSVAFVRTPGNRSDESPYLDPPRQPWSIWVADAATGSARRVWEAHRGMGTTFYPSETSSQQLCWMNGGSTIAFLWEGDGWQHIYAVPAAGGDATRLTTGAFEVETFAGSIDGSSLYYATNEGAIDWRHIWQVGLDAQPHQVTTGAPFNQWGPVPLAQSRLAYVSASYNVPPTVMIGDQALTANLVPSEFPAGQLVQPKLVTFKAPDGLTIHGQLFLPRTPGKHAGILFDHGGPVRQMLAGFHYMDAYTFLYESNQYLVSRGFAVLSVNYRSGIMYGNAFRNPKKCCWWGSSEYQDVVAGARFLQAQPQVDPKRIGIYGLSYGGLLTALGLARNSDIFKAGADIAGVHNWAFDIDVGAGKPLGTPEQRKVAYDASPVASLSTWRSPVLISQGDDDRNVPFAEGVDLATR